MIRSPLLLGYALHVDVARRRRIGVPRLILYILVGRPVLVKFGGQPAPERVVTRDVKAKSFPDRFQLAID